MNVTHILFEKHLAELGFVFQREYRFHDKRQWRLDYIIGCAPAYYSRSWAVEIEGGIHVRGRHTRGKGFEEDCLKYSTAAAMGYKVLRFTTEQVLSGKARQFLLDHICEKRIAEAI